MCIRSNGLMGEKLEQSSIKEVERDTWGRNAVKAGQEVGAGFAGGGWGGAGDTRMCVLCSIQRLLGGLHSSFVGIRTRCRLESRRPSDQRESMSPMLTAIPPSTGSTVSQP